MDDRFIYLATLLLIATFAAYWFRGYLPAAKQLGQRIRQGWLLLQHVRNLSGQTRTANKAEVPTNIRLDTQDIGRRTRCSVCQQQLSPAQVAQLQSTQVRCGYAGEQPCPYRKYN